VLLRQSRHSLFDGPFQDELANLYRKEELGRPPVTSTMLALALILQKYTGVSDDEVRDRDHDGSAMAACCALRRYGRGTQKPRNPALCYNIVLPTKITWKIFDKLDQANSHERILYPGLDGRCRRLRR
jgi:hypothetical protein